MTSTIISSTAFKKFPLVGIHCNCSDTFMGEIGLLSMKLPCFVEVLAEFPDLISRFSNPRKSSVDVGQDTTTDSKESVDENNNCS